MEPQSQVTEMVDQKEANVLSLTSKLKEQLETRGERIEYGNILALTYLSEAGVIQNSDSLTLPYQQLRQVAEETSFGEVDLKSVRELSDKVSLKIGIKVPQLSDKLIVPKDQIRKIKDMAAVDSEIIQKTNETEGAETVDVYRYVNTVGWRDSNFDMEPGEIVDFMKQSPEQAVLSGAKGLRLPFKDSDTGPFYSDQSTPFTIDQMLDVPFLVLQRTREYLYRGTIIEERYAELLCKTMLLSKREMLANVVQSEKQNTPYLSATLDNTGLRNWGRYRITTSVPTDQLLNVRDLSIQYDEVMGNKPATEIEKERLKNTLHSTSPEKVEYNTVGGQQLDEVAILGGIRKNRVTEIFDTEEEKVIWPSK